MAVNEQTFRVLIVRTGAMGDVLHAMPAVAALRKLHPEWEIAWAIEPQWSELLEVAGESTGSFRSPKMPLVDRWHGVRTREWKRRPVSGATFADVMSLRRNLRAGRFDLCVDMQGLIRSAVVGRMAGAGQFVGREEPRERLARMFYEQRVPVTAAHVVEQGCELLGSAVGEALRPTSVALPVDDAAETWCDELLSRAAPDGRFVVIAPTAGWGAKEWPVERYGALAAALGRAGYAVLVNASAPENATVDALVRSSKGSAVAIPSSIGQMIALMRRASLVIAGDTGPLHLAAVVERPVVAIFGPTDPARTGPYGVGTMIPGRVLRDPSSVTDHTRRTPPDQGLLKIEVDEVLDACLAVLKQDLGETGWVGKDEVQR
ncbi:lipopolysaccharide heptosyltransferase I [Granulicella sp. dw_53]|uniref:lipopolysaccharide heptosyltransferase I n=1 Tax=Granulicella sp. dw_53 TaxID=2719792 RepID=UPI0031F704F9